VDSSSAETGGLARRVQSRDWRPGSVKDA
jgi:hypothetical protein